MAALVEELKGKVPNHIDVTFNIDYLHVFSTTLRYAHYT